MFTLFRSHTCITFELLSINLYELIKKNKFQGFSLQLVRKFAHSLLQCLDTLWRNKIIHCDMKPENVLLKQQGRSGIKVGQQLFNFYWKQFLLLGVYVRLFWALKEQLCVDKHLSSTYFDHLMKLAHGPETSNPSHWVFVLLTAYFHGWSVPPDSKLRVRITVLSSSSCQVVMMVLSCIGWLYCVCVRSIKIC